MITDFISSASAASSSSGPSDNIADLTKSARPKKLQDDKHPDNDDDFFRNLDLTAGDPQTQNDVVPDIIQKKIGNILRKIQFFTSLSGSGRPGGGNADGEGSLEDFDDEFDEEPAGTTEKTEQDGGDKKQQVEIVPETASEGQQQTGTEKPVEPSKLTEAANNLAVFFMELIGSVVGLAYGAVAQITAATPKP